MLFYRLSEAELEALERDPGLLPQYLAVWRRAIEEQKTQRRKTQEFIHSVAAASGEEIISTSESTSASSSSTSGSK